MKNMLAKPAGSSESSSDDSSEVGELVYLYFVWFNAVSGGVILQWSLLQTSVRETKIIHGCCFFGFVLLCVGFYYVWVLCVYFL